MLSDATLAGADVVELAPGLGKTALSILDRAPASYTGVEFDDDAVALTRAAVGERGRVISGEAADTGLPDASADVVLGEAMLTMQSDAHKAKIASEAYRMLRPGGRYAIHELALRPDGLNDDVKTEIRRALAQSIKINARPLTAAEWQQLLTGVGFRVDAVSYAPMALLEPRRVIADEGLLRTMRFVSNLVLRPDARARVLGMRATFSKYRDHMAAIEIIATKS